MKNLILLITLISIHIVGLGQQVIVNKGLTIELPAGAQKLNMNQIIIFADSNHYERRAMPANPKNVYKINNMLLAFYESRQYFKEGDLEQNKISTDNIFKRYTSKSNYTSYIKTYKNCQARVSKIVEFYTITYLFYSVNSTDTWNLRGIIECKKADEVKTDELLEKILNSVKFAEQ